MKRSAAVHLTLVTSLAAGAAACGPDRPRQTLRGYCDPASPEVCVEQPRSGYVPMYYPIFWGGMYYDRRGVARTGPGGRVVQGAPRPVVARGGFGGTGSGRGVGA